MLKTSWTVLSYVGIHDETCIDSKELLDIVIGSEKRPTSSSTNSTSPSRTADANNASTSIPQQPTSSQLQWDSKDGQAHTLITLSVKHHIVPQSCYAQVAT